MYVFKRIYSYIVDYFEVFIQCSCRLMRFEHFLTNVTLRFIIITFNKIFLRDFFFLIFFYCLYIEISGKTAFLFPRHTSPN